MYFLVNSLSLVFLPHGGFKRLKWDISRITIALWKISFEHIRLSLVEFNWIISNHDKMILFTSQAFQMPIIKDLKVHNKILDQQVFWNLTFSHAGVILTCVYLSFQFFVFGSEVSELRKLLMGNQMCWNLRFSTGSFDHFLSQIIFSARLFSQQDNFFSQIIFSARSFAGHLFC